MRIGYKECGYTLYIEAFHLATAEKAWALAGIATQQLVHAELEEGKIDSAKRMGDSV